MSYHAIYFELPVHLTYSGMSSDDWTYSSDEDDKTRDGKKIKEKSSGSVQSIIQMISNKKNDHTSVVDTNLLSKVANVINMSPDSAGKYENRMICFDCVSTQFSSVLIPNII